MYLAILFITATFLLTGDAYADYSTTDGTFFCNSNDLVIEKSDYSYLVYQENKYWYGEAPQDIAATLLKMGYSKTLDDLGKTYNCLKSNGIDPDSVTPIPSYLLDGLDMAKAQDPAKFFQVAPNFSNYVPVPEFGSLATMVAVVSIMAAILVSKRFRLNF